MRRSTFQGEELEEKGRSLGARVFGVIVGLALIVAGALVMIQNEVIRGWDAAVSGWMMQFVGIGKILVIQEYQAVFYHSGYPEMHGVQVTVECGSSFLVGPALILAGLLAMSGRFGVLRTVAALFVACAVMLLANWSRITMIAWATANWGVDDGYQWSHTVVGSVMVIVGVLIGAFLGLLVLVRRSRRAARA